MKPITTLLLLLALSSPLFAQENAVESKKESAEKQAAKEVPPPKTLEETHLELDKLLPKEELAKIDAMKTEEEMIVEYHFSLGMSMRNSWGLWGGGPLAEHMNKLGFHHPDDISGVILETFWCKRHKKDFRLKERAAYYDTYWKASASPPDTAKDPQDGSDVEWKMSLGDGDDKSPRMIHVGKSKKTGRWLAYEYDKGIYTPDAALMKRINYSESSDPFGQKEPTAK